MKLPLKLRKYQNIFNLVSEPTITDLIDQFTYKGITIDMLVGMIAKHLLRNDKNIILANDGSYAFKQVLLMAIYNIVISNTTTTTETRTVVTKQGISLIKHETIDTNKEQKHFIKQWFHEATEPEYNLWLKGSEKLITSSYRKSTYILNQYSQKTYKVRDIEDKYINLYTAMKFSETFNSVSESKILYKKRLLEIAEETKLYRGYEFKNYRKLDNSGRDYPLSRFGFANEYGDAFEKWLIQPVNQPYQVTKQVIKEARELHKSEFGIFKPRSTYKRLLREIDENLIELEKFHKGMNYNFTIDSKTLGKYLYIIEIIENTIFNEGGSTTVLATYDLTNSGIIMYANLFGDEKLLKTANLLGGEKIDSHQLVADAENVSRKSAKKLFVASNHGGKLPPELEQTKDIVFGKRYDVIRKIAEFGIDKALSQDKTRIEYTMPDGFKVIWQPYILNCKTSVSKNKNISTIMPFDKMANDGTANPKVSGFAVSLAHSSDSYIVRKVDRIFQQYGINIKTTLDNYYVPFGTKKVLIEAVFSALSDLNQDWFKLVKEQAGISDIVPERTIDIIKSANIF